MSYSKVDIRTWSILGSRGTFGVALTDAARSNPGIIALSADLCNTSGLDRFRNAYPTRFINTGIAEQNMLGVAAGLAATGFVPFATTFANFAALRSCEQVRHYLGYMQENVKLVGFGAGFAMGMFGVTHFALEDIAALRSISNLTIISPADGMEIVKATNTIAVTRGPVYLRLTGVMNAPIVYKEDYDFTIGKAITLREGDAVAIVATGSMVHPSLKAAEILATQGIMAQVVNVHTIKPLDTAAVDQLLNHRLVVTVEEHSIMGGLGTSIAEHVAQKRGFPPLLRIGVAQGYPHVGHYQHMLEVSGLTAPKIAGRIRLALDDTVGLSHE
jgi:transketolase